MEARTTTGFRPEAETLRAYARKAGALVLQALAEGLGAFTGPAAGGGGAGGTVSLAGEREFLTVERAEMALKGMLEGPEGTVTAVKFSTKSFGDGSAAVAANALRRHSESLTAVDLSDTISGRPEDEALRALGTFCEGLAACRLKSLDLSDNALGEKGVRACAALLQEQPALQDLHFQNVGCSPFACAAIAELLCNPGELRKLHLFNNMSDDAGAQAIAALLARAPKIADFKMVSSRVKEAGGQFLAQVLAGKPLERLNLSDNPMGATCGPAFNALLAACAPTLKHLNLSEVCLEDEGLLALLPGLARCTGLESLELGANEIMRTGMRALAGCLKAFPRLKVLNVKENEFGDKGALALAEALVGLDQLETLDLYQNEVKNAGALALVKALADKPHLKFVDLNANYIADAVVEEVQFYAQETLHLGEGVLREFDDNMEDMADEEEDSDND